MNIQKMMRQAQEMQERLQSQLAELEVEGSAGGGAVAVRVNGHKQVLAVTIESEVLDPEDPSLVQDLVLAAVNEAGRKVDEAMKETMGGMLGGMPGML